MQIDKLKNFFSEKEICDAYNLIDSLDSEKTIEAVVGLSEGNLNWLKKYTKLAKKNKLDVIHAYNVRKKEKESENDIWISATEKIKWVNFDVKTDLVKSIDDQIESIIPFVKSLEIHCDSLCCGVRAFSYHKNDIVEKFNEQNDQENTRIKLLAIIENIHKIEEDVVSSRVLNQLIHKSVMLKLLSHIEASLPST